MAKISSTHSSEPSSRYRPTNNQEGDQIETRKKIWSAGVLPQKKITLLVLVATTASVTTPMLQQASFPEGLTITLPVMGFLFITNWIIDIVMVE